MLYKQPGSGCYESSLWLANMIGDRAVNATVEFGRGMDPGSRSLVAHQSGDTVFKIARTAESNVGRLAFRIANNPHVSSIRDIAETSKGYF